MRLPYCLVFCLGLMLACQPLTNPEQPAATFPAIADTVFVISRADSLFKLGEYYDLNNKKDSAIYFHEESLKLKMGRVADTSLFKDYSRLGNLYRHLYKIRQADEHFEKAKSLAESNPKISSITKVNLYLSLAYCKRELINYGEARANTRKAQRIVEQEYPNDQYLMGRIINTFGNLYYVEKQYDLAIKNYEQAILHFERVDRFGEIGSALLNIAIIHSNLKAYKNALRYLDESIRYVRLVNNEESESVATGLLNKAGVLYDLGLLDSAKYYYRKCLSIRLKIFGEKNINVFGARFEIAKLFLDMGQLDSASYYFHQSIKSLVKSFNDPNLTALPHPDHLDISKDLAWALSEKAKILAALYNKDSSDNNLLHSSVGYLRLADSVLSVYRRYLSFEDQQFALMQSEETDYQMGLEIPYEVGLQCALKLYERTGEERHLEDAIYFMENSRAKLLSEAMTQAEFRNEANIPNEIFQQQNNLFRKRAEILQSYQSNPSDSLDQLLAEISKGISITSDKLNKISLNYSLTTFEQNLPSVNELKKLAEKLDATLLEYYWSGQELFVVAINRDGIEFKSISITGELEEKLDLVLKSLDKQAGDFTNTEEFIQFVKSAHYLYNKLLPSHVRTSNSIRLIISPHGKLSFLPFEILVDALPDTSEVNYNLPYLLHRYTISYSQGFQFLSKHEMNQRKEAKLLAMGFSLVEPEVDGKNRSGVVGLPGTEQEISSIKDVMKNHSNTYYLGANASETTFKSEAPGYNIVHLAVHGESDSLNGLNSRLIFRSEVDSINDGNLYAYELYSLNLRNASLVVLSACESGIGKQQPGEGFLSIARGFMYAGCPSQVISLWKIDDRTSAKVMSIFYQQLSEGKEIDVSLALAKKAYLTGANEFNTHPSLWAAFLQVGEGHTVLVAPSPFFNYRFLILISGIALLSGILIWIFRRKSRQI